MAGIAKKFTSMLRLTTAQKMHHVLRIATAMCFIGHGAFGIITKPIWCNYFAVFGIGHDMAYRLMPVVGTIDILLGIVIIFYPLRAIAGWLVIWGIITASLRPLSGEPFAEMVERAGNFGAPLALLLLSGHMPKRIAGWFRPINPNVSINPQVMQQVTLCLQVVVFLLLLGHGWLNLLEKKALLSQYSGLGFSQPATVARVAGLFEIFAACTVLLLPARPVLMFFFIWKAGTELFYPHWELFEWVERGGSYGTILALWFLVKGDAEAAPKQGLLQAH